MIDARFIFALMDLDHPKPGQGTRIVRVNGQLPLKFSRSVRELRSLEVNSADRLMKPRRLRLFPECLAVAE